VSAIFLQICLHDVLCTEDCLDDDIENSGPEQVHVNANLLEVLAEGTQRPLVAEVVLLCGFILNELVIFLVN